MSFLPVVERELRAASRRSATYWARFQVALAALLPAFFLLLGPMGSATPAEQGMHVFQVLGFVAFFHALMSGMRLTADCLSREKREGTLGFLFLTDLKPHDVVFGKLAATSCAALYGLLASLPVLAVPVMLGGITPADVLRLALVLVNSLFFALALAMFVSALSWQEKQATGMAMLLLFGFGGGLPLVGTFVGEMVGHEHPAYWLGVASPGHACGRISSAAYAASPWAFWISTVFTHGMGWLFLALTCLVLPKVWQDRPAAGRRLRWREWCRRALLGDSASRAAYRREALAINPIFWLSSRERRVVWYPWFFLGSMAVLVIIVWRALKIREVDLLTLLVCSAALNLFFKHWLAVNACHAFSTDRDKGALELLLSTPLGVRDLLRGQARGLWWQFRKPVVVLLASQLAFFGAALWSGPSELSRHDSTFAPTFLAAQFVFVADLIALAWVGWWQGVVSRNAAAALASTYLRIMVLPWLFTMLALVLAAVLMGANDAEFFGIGVLVWTASSLLADVFFALRSREKLLTQLRSAAVERYSGNDASLKWWRRVGRAVGRGFSGAPQAARS